MNKRLYSRIIPFGTDSYIVRRKRLWGIVDSQGNILLPIAYTRVHWFEGGYAGIQIDSKWGLVDCNGCVTIEPQYDSILYFTQGNACKVEKDNCIFVVDVNGNEIMKVEGKNVGIEGNKILVRSKDEWQLFNFDGTPFSRKHAFIQYLGERYSAIDFEGEKSYGTVIKADGTELRMPAFEKIGLFFEHITEFKENGKYGIIDENGNVVLPNAFDFIHLCNGIIAVNYGCGEGEFSHHFEGKWRLWDYQFNDITPYQYDATKCEYIGEGNVWFAKREGIWYKVTTQGETFFAKNDQYEKKINQLNEHFKSESEDGLFGVLSDENYKGEGRKLLVRSCDGLIIRRFYYTPYLATPIRNVSGQWTIGEFIVNKYGQDMPDLHPFKMPERKKPRLIFKYPNKLSNLSKQDTFSLFARLLNSLGVTKDDAVAIILMNKTTEKQHILCDWLIRKIKRNKDFKIECGTILLVSEAIDVWQKKHKHK